MSSSASVFLDTNTLITMVEGPSDVGRNLRAFFESALTEGRASFHVSSLCVAELYVKPYRDQDLALTKAYVGLLSSGKLAVHSITDAVLETAAVIRTKTRLKLPDAIQLATASVTRCSFLLTFDKGFTDLGAVRHPLFEDVTISPVKIIRPDPAALSELSKALQ